MQTGAAIVFVAFEARVVPAVWLFITVTVLDKIFPLKKKIVIRVDHKFYQFLGLNWLKKF